MDTAQILLIIVVIALTVLLILLGLQVFFILKELQKSVRKINKVLDDTGVISESIATPVANLSTIVSGIKTGVSLLNFLKKKPRSTSSGHMNRDVDEEAEDGERS